MFLVELICGSCRVPRNCEEFMKNWLLVLLFVCFSFVVGCGSGRTQLADGDIQKQEIFKLYMPQPGQFSLMIKVGNELQQLDLNTSNYRIRVLADVPLGEPMWFEKRDNEITVHINTVFFVESSELKPDLTGKLP